MGRVLPVGKREARDVTAAGGGLLCLQHAFALSDEAVVARGVENPYYQHFCGETFFQHRPPIDPSSLTRWRQRMGEEGVEWLLTKSEEEKERPQWGVSPTNEAGRASGTVADKSWSGCRSTPR